MAYLEVSSKHLNELNLICYIIPNGENPSSAFVIIQWNCLRCGFIFDDSYNILMTRLCCIVLAT